MAASRSPLTNRPTSPAAAAAPDVHRLQAQLAVLVEGGDGGPEGSLERLLLHLRALLAARTVAWLPVPGGADTEVVIVGVESPGLKRLVDALDGTKTQVLPTPALGPHGYTLSVPIWREGRSLGWLVTQMEIAQSRDIQAFAVLLQTFAGFLLYRAQRLAVGELHHALEASSGLIEVFRRAGREMDFEKACRMALDALCVHLGCSRAYLGLRRRGAIRVTAISGTTRVDPKSPSLQPLEAAMKEAVTRGEPMDWATASPRTETTVAREILAERSGAKRILTLPLPQGRGALLCEWDAAPAPGTAPTIDAAVPFVPILFDLLERARPSPVVFSAKRLWSRASANRRRAVLLGVGAVAVLLAWPFPYRVGADCRIAPTIKQVVAAPFDGQLRKSHVRPGDAVREGDVLGELDNRELKLKEAELVATRDRALKQRDRAMAGGVKGEGADFAASQMASFEAQSVGQELQLVRKKLAMLEVKSPLAGVVVSGDLRRAEGQPVPRGQVLWEVSPLDAMIVEIDVPDREVSHLRTGQPVRVRLEAYGGGRWDTAVQRIHPQSEQRDGKNSFIVEADIATDRLSDLRPGMRGRAMIETDRHPLGWIIGHRFWEWLVTSLFW